MSLAPGDETREKLTISFVCVRGRNGGLSTSGGRFENLSVVWVLWCREQGEGEGAAGRDAGLKGSYRLLRPAFIHANLFGTEGVVREGIRLYYYHARKSDSIP